MLRTSEDKHLCELALSEKVMKHVYLILPAYFDDVLVDVPRGVSRLHGDADRLLEKILNERLYLARHGRGEEERVAFLGHLRHHESHIMDEAHVEHAVGFVEHHRFELRKLEILLLHKVLESAGGADDKVVLIAEIFDLIAHARTAHTDDGKYLEALGEAPKFLIYLNGELARRNHNKDALAGMLENFIDERDEKGCRLAGAGIRDTNDIAPKKHMWYSTVLNGSRGLVTLGRNIVFESLLDIEIAESVFGHEVLDFLGDDRRVTNLVTSLNSPNFSGALAAVPD